MERVSLWMHVWTNLTPLNKILYIKEENLTQLFNLGHAIGLHSHYHANNMHLKSEKEQFDEYSYNQKKLASILKCDKSNIYSTSHPLGKYNEFTFNVLKSLQIKIGFRDSMTVDGWYKMKQINNSELEIAREDCATIIKMLNL